MRQKDKSNQENNPPYFPNSCMLILIISKDNINIRFGLLICMLPLHDFVRVVAVHANVCTCVRLFVGLNQKLYR